MLRKTLNIGVPLLILIVGALGAQALVNAAAEPQPRVPEDRRPVVRVIGVTEETVRLDVETYGTVRPRTEIAIVPQVAGRVEFVASSLKKGGFFKEGDTLVRIEKADYELAVALAKAGIKQAEAGIIQATAAVTQAGAGITQAEAVLQREEAESSVAKREWEQFGKGDPNPLVLREPQMAEAKAMVESAKANRDSAIAKLASAKAQLETAKAHLATAELNLSRTEIRAPCAGRVRTENVDPGQFVVAGAPIASVYATDYVEVRLSVPDHEVRFLDLPLDHSIDDPAVENGDGSDRPSVKLVSFFAGAQHEWSGEIVRTEAEVDPKTRVVHCVVRVRDPYAKRADGGPPLMIGMYVKALIPGREATAAVLPRYALRAGDRVLVVGEGNKMAYRNVEVIRKEPGRVLIASGLAAGDRVCVTEVAAVVDGMQVRIDREGADQ